MIKKQKGVRGRGESPMRVCVLVKKSRVEYYIFFTPISSGNNIKSGYNKNVYIIKSGQMQVQRFEKKKSILKYLGKDGKDVRALSRMIERGEVEFDGAYYSLKGNGVSEDTQPKQTTSIENFLPPEKTISSKVDTNISTKVDKNLKEELEMEKINTKYYKDGMYAVKDVYDKVIEEVFNLCYAKHEVRAKAREVVVERLSHIEQLK